MPDELPSFSDTSELIEWVKSQRNDLQEPAIAAAPVIGEVLEVLGGLPECRLARMSGSGATCFALFETDSAAIAAGTILEKKFPEWWLSGGALGGQTGLAIPKVS